jgi:hypothetical protein
MACSMYGKGKKCIKSLVGKLERKSHKKGLGIAVLMGRCGLGLSNSG